MQEFQWIIAATLAEQHHQGQMYGEFPYVKHLLDVDRLVIEHEFTAPRSLSEQYIKVPGEYRDLVRAALWLHDVIEDTSCKISDLREKGICNEVIEAVDLLTKKPGYILADYINAICTNPIARTVKKWDSFANFEQNVREKNYERALKYAHQFWVLNKGEWYEPTTIYKAA